MKWRKGKGAEHIYPNETAIFYMTTIKGTQFSKHGKCLLEPVTDWLLYRWLLASESTRIGDDMYEGSLGSLGIFDNSRVMFCHK